MPEVIKPINSPFHKSPLDIAKRREIEEAAGATAAGLAVQPSFLPIVQPPAATQLCPMSPLSPMKIGSKSIISSPDNASNPNALNAHTIKKLETLLKTPPKKDQEVAIEVLLHEILKMLEKEEKNGIQLKYKLLEGNKLWQETVRKNIEENTKSVNKSETVENWVKRGANALGPLAIIVGAIISIATGGVGLVALAGAAIGALLFIDTILDDAAKKSLANWLGKGSEESEKAWLGRIQFSTSVLTLALSLGVSGIQAVQVATKVSEVALNAIRTGAEWKGNTYKALLIEMRAALENSNRNADDSLKDIDHMADIVRGFYESLMRLHNIMSETTTQVLT
jgi:hypothetical protein